MKLKTYYIIRVYDYYYNEPYLELTKDLKFKSPKQALHWFYNCDKITCYYDKVVYRRYEQ